MVAAELAAEPTVELNRELELLLIGADVKRLEEEPTVELKRELELLVVVVANVKGLPEEEEEEKNGAEVQAAFMNGLHAGPTPKTDGSKFCGEPVSWEQNSSKNCRTVPTAPSLQSISIHNER